MIKPILHRLILKLDEVEEVTQSGIIIANTLVNKERKAVEQGVVVAIGDTCFKDYGGSQDTVKVGDRVTIAKYSGKEVKDGEDTLVIVNDEDILCIHKDED